MESFSDDGEKFGGGRVLKVLREQNAVDVLSVCCRWVSVKTSLSLSCRLIFHLVQYGGDMIGVGRSPSVRQLQSPYLASFFPAHTISAHCYNSPDFLKVTSRTRPATRLAPGTGRLR